MTSSRSSRRLLRAAAVALLCFAFADPARAADPPPEPITAGTVDWGLKESFRTYITGGIAQGTIATSDGATRTPAGTFAFPVTGGVFDPAVNGTVASTAGAVRFTGHHGELDIRISDVRVELLPEGALMRADVVSLPRGSATSTEYLDTVLAELDLDAVDPVSAGGITTWTEIPARLTPSGAPAFGGFYSAGAALDPVTLTYTGNGGKPQPDGFTPGGTPFYAGIAAETPGTRMVFLDPDRGLVHKPGNDAINAVDDATIATVGTPFPIDAPVNRQIAAAAFDAAAGRIFVLWTDSTASAFTWTGSGYTRDELPGTYAGNLLAFTGGKLYVTADTQRTDPAVTVVSGAPGAWTVQTDYPPIATGGLGIRDIEGMPDGRLVVTVQSRLSFSPTTMTPQPALHLTDTGGAFTQSAIPGTAPPPHVGAPMSHTMGYAWIEPGPDGSLLLAELLIGIPSVRLQWVVPDGNGDLAADGAAIAVQPSTETPMPYAIDPEDGRIYLPYKGDQEGTGRIEVRERDGTAVTTIDGLFTRNVEAAADSTLFAIAEDAAGELPTVRLQLAGTSPTLSGHPQDATVVLPAAGATASASFGAQADAAPDATVQWQQRPLGATRWSAVAGATATTLRVDAALGLSGTRYRAVFENAGGRIGSRPATLTVTVAPPKAPDQPKQSATQPDPPTATPPPARSAIGVLAGVRRAGRDGVVRVATVRCAAGGATCRVAVPKRARVRIGGRSYTARVLAPATVAAGKRAAVRVKLPRAALRRLGRRTVKVTVKVVLRASGAAPLMRTATVRVRG